MFDADIFCFDVETTSADAYSARVVQLAYKRIYSNSNKVCNGTLVINPNEPIQPGASAVHGFTNEAVANEPQFSFHASTLYNLMHNTYWCGYNNSRFDNKIITREFDLSGYEATPKCLGVLDAYKVFTKFHGRGAKGTRTLKAAHLHYCGEEFANAHDAEADITATINVVSAQIKAHDLSLEDYVKLAGRKDGFIDENGFFQFDLCRKVPIISCGKFAKVEMQAVPIWYYNWMITKGTFNKDTKEIAANAIQGVYPIWKD